MADYYEKDLLKVKLMPAPIAVMDEDLVNVNVTVTMPPIYRAEYKPYGTQLKLDDYDPMTASEVTKRMMELLSRPLDERIMHAINDSIVQFNRSSAMLKYWWLPMPLFNLFYRKGWL